MRLLVGSILGALVVVEVSPVSYIFAQSNTDCSAIKTDSDRLACYDKLNTKQNADEAVIKKAKIFVSKKIKGAKFGSSVRSMRSNGSYSMDVVCGTVNGMGYYYWVEKDDGGIDDGGMADHIGYEVWCK